MDGECREGKDVTLFKLVKTLSGESGLATAAGIGSGGASQYVENHLNSRVCATWAKSKKMEGVAGEIPPSHVRGDWVG